MAVVIVFALAACSSSAATDGGSGSSTAGTTTTTGGSSVPACVGVQCMYATDCCTGTICGVNIFSCCVPDGNPCSTELDCCNLGCNTQTLLCESQFPTSSSTGGSTTGSGTTGGTTGGSTGGLTTGGTSGGSTTGSPLVEAVQFTWTFNGTQTCEQAGIGWVQISNFAGLPVQLVPCRGTDGMAGTTFQFLQLGATSYQLVAFAAGSNRAIYAINGTTTVTDGLTTVAAVFLQQVNPTGSNLSFQWTFNGSSNACTSGALDAGVQVTVASDAGFSGQFPCGTNGLAGSYAAGTYPYTISALLGDGGVAYQATGNATVNGITDTTILADLPPAMIAGSQGALIATLTFGGQTCVSAGTDTLYFTLRDSSGNIAGSGNNDSMSPCVDNNGTLGGTHYFSLITPGTYWLEVTGLVTTTGVPTATEYFTGQVTVSPNYTATVSADASPPP